MMRLDQLQQSVQNYLLGDTARAPLLNESRDRLDIYRRGYALRLVEAADGPRPYLHVRGGLEARHILAEVVRREEGGIKRHVGEHAAGHRRESNEGRAVARSGGFVGCSIHTVIHRRCG